MPKAEAKLFSVLLAHAGEVVSSNELVIECTVDEQLTPSAIKVRVGRMRALLEPLCSTIIETCRGQGFRIPLSVLVEDDGEPEASGMNWSRAA
ncbi:helix-turn-helix domain-containing protein [Phenylobacterium sp.]|uniref:helix-turn-helix domain-containing protein n=1 Tax=Phenylobacterium sp. TaxID=1871053 RepID=UPI002E32D511|nr:helix-turn-helix domain-containing protein [Phenylobacterium sp.]HEX4711435.1 helix-turn-helix domain-containing protein [Phenylobacterium sp.]